MQHVTAALKKERNGHGILLKTKANQKGYRQQVGSPKSSATTTYNSTTVTNRQTDGQMDFTTEQS